MPRLTRDQKDAVALLELGDAILPDECRVGLSAIRWDLPKSKWDVRDRKKNRHLGYVSMQTMNDLMEAGLIEYFEIDAQPGLRARLKKGVR